VIGIGSPRYRGRGLKIIEIKAFTRAKYSRVSQLHRELRGNFAWL
jgi:hypothetical protein